MTDMNLGIYTANLDLTKSIYATTEKLQISHHHFHNIELGDFIQGLIDANLKAPPATPCRPAPALRNPSRSSPWRRSPSPGSSRD